jgi:hypothetical protein
MKTTRKYLFLILGALFAALLTPAQAQSPTYAAQTLGSFTVAGAAATNLAYIIDCRKQASVELQINNRKVGSDTDADTFYVTRSVDGVTYHTALQAITITPVASTASVVCTNVPTYGCGYIKINYWTNASTAAAISTNTLQYAVKISAP